jgi:hypothetical protein
MRGGGGLLRRSCGGKLREDAFGGNAS